MNIDNNNLAFNFDADFCAYTKALYELKDKYPSDYKEMHEFASSLINIYDSVEDVIEKNKPVTDGTISQYPVFTVPTVN